MVRGSPIRKSSDHSLVIDSPRLIADSYVLHRFLVPRHPPYALKNLHKILRTNLRNAYRALQMLRVHYAILKQHTATPTNHTKLMQPAQGLPTQKKQTVPSGPNNVPTPNQTPTQHFPQPLSQGSYSRRAGTQPGTMIDVPPLSNPHHTLGDEKACAP